MNSKLGKEDNNTIMNLDKEHHNKKDHYHNKGRNERLSLQSDSVFIQYKQSAKVQKTKVNNAHKSLYESLLAKSGLWKSSVLSDEVKVRESKNKGNSPSLHNNNNSSKSKNKNDQKLSNCVLTVGNKLVSHHNKNKSSLIFFNKKSGSKDKNKGINLIRTDVFKKVSKDGNNTKDKYDLLKSQMNISKKGIMGENKKGKIEPHHQQTKTLVEISSILPKNNGVKTISRSNSISNLDKSTTEATTTSKRLQDNILKLSLNKPFVYNNYNIQLNKDLAAIYSNQFNSVKGSNTKNKRNFILNNSITNNNQTISKNAIHQTTIGSQIVNTEEGSQTNWYNNNHNVMKTEMNTIDNHSKSKKNSNKSMSKYKNISENICSELFEKGIKKSKLNDTGSLSLLSEDSAFNNSKQRSTSGNHNNSNSLMRNQNDSLSIKQTSQKHSSNNTSNIIERKSKSKERPNSGNDFDPTVSFTYSDEEIADQKSRRSKRNIGKIINDDDFYTFYKETSKKLFGLDYNNK